MKKRLLINWAFFKPVGHLFEALQHARGYYAANHDIVDVYLLINAAPPTSLVEACRWVTGVYPRSISLSLWIRAIDGAPGKRRATNCHPKEFGPPIKSTADFYPAIPYFFR